MSREPSSQQQTPATELSIREVVDSRPVSRFHYALLALGGSVMFLDGFDTQAISFAAPAIAKEWGLPAASLGPILSAAIAGLMAGYLALAPLANRIGHRRIVLVCTTVFGILTLLCAFADTSLQLIALRFLTGAGLGAAIPSIVALVSEFAPTRRRSSFVMFIYCWLALGFVAAGIVSGIVIPMWGWRSMFVIGGSLPLLLLVPLMRYFPESPTYLCRSGARQRAVEALRRLAPGLSSNVVLFEETIQPTGLEKSKPFTLVRGQWLVPTVLLWIAFMTNLAAFYAIQSWLPTIVSSQGHSPSLAIAATVLTTIGGVAAATVIGPAMDRINAFRVLGSVYLGGAVFVAILGSVLMGTSAGLLLMAAFLTGTCVAGGQMSVIALATVVYPTAMRPTGVGWALGIGRIGGIAGPLLVGAALGAQMSSSSVFVMMALVLVGASASVFALERRLRTAAVERRTSPTPTG
nr:MFS transporter [Rhodococcus wratislaviensis]